MSIQLVHLKGNRGALEAFMMLMRYKMQNLLKSTDKEKNNVFQKFRPGPTRPAKFA